MIKERLVYIDLLNIMACYGVVWLHCSGDAFTFRMDKYWLMSLCIQVIAHWAVPVFFMLTGANLMDYREKYSTSVYFKRRMTRIFLPFLFWSTFYFIWKCALGWLSYTGARDLATAYLSNGIEGIFWFFYPLFGVYVCMPVLSILADERYKKQLYYMAGLGIIAYAFMPLLPGVLGIQYTSELNPPIVGGYVTYVLLGWILKNEEFSLRVRRILYAAGIFGAASMFTGTIWLSLRDGGILNDLLWGYMMYPTLFMACALFLLLKHCRWQILYKEKVQRVLAKLSGASFGVYLIHIMIVNALVVDGPVNGDSRWWMLFGAAGIYLICIGIVLAAKKIPGIKYLFP